MAKDTGIVWREIPGFARYHVSRTGQIRSLRVWYKPRILKPAKLKNGYLKVMLGRKNSRYVHELVLLAFAGPRPDGFTASHLNGKRTDNRAENLRWESWGDNNRRQAEHGTQQMGETNGHARLTKEQVRIIRAVKNPDHGWYTCIAHIYGVHPNTIRDVHQGRTWRHV